MAPPVGDLIEQQQAPAGDVVGAGCAQLREPGGGVVHHREEQDGGGGTVDVDADARAVGVPDSVGDQLGDEQYPGVGVLFEVPAGQCRADQGPCLRCGLRGAFQL